MKQQCRCKRSLLALLVTILVGFSTYAADLPDVTLNVNKVPVERVLKQIEQQTSFRFSFKKSSLKDFPTVTLNCRNESLASVLNRIFDKSGLTYEIINGKSIVIVPKTKASSENKGNKSKGSKKITGRITDKEGEPLIGVTVMAKGSNQAAVTDLDGNFTLSGVTTGEDVSVSYVGYLPTSFKIGSNDSYDVSMTENSELLDEVVVVGYGSQKKVNLTGAVSSLSQEELKDRPVDNLGRQLQGMVPNLNVTLQSGQPGAGATLNVRGTTSPNGGEPLVLIDGVEGSLDRINSNDVANISVLKDASSAAIYGARAAFGVILITTKNGKKDQKPTVSYSGSYSFSSPTTSTDFETRGYYAAKIADLFLSTVNNVPYTSYTEDEYQMLYDRRNDVTENPDRPWVITQTKNGRKEYLYLANFDWYNYMYDNSRPAWDHNVSVTGGVKAFRYMVSGRYYQQTGVNRVQPDKFKSYNMRAKLAVDILPNLTLSNNTKFFSSEYDYKGYDTGNNGEYYNFRRPTLHALPFLVPVNPDGTAVSHTSATNSSAHYVMDGYNAVIQKGKTGGHNKTKELSTMFELEYRVIPELTLKADFSYTYTNLRNDFRSVPVEYSQYPGEIAKEAESGAHSNAYKEVVQDRNYYVADVYASYDNCWKDVHNFSGIVGYNYEAKYYRNLSAKNTGLLSEDLSDFNLAKGTDNFEILGGRNEYAIMGLFYRLAYNYDERYLVEVNGRYDGSSRFPRGKRFGFFPSFSAGWRVSQEKFFEPLSNAISNLKIRASYGQLGNQQIGYYDFIQTINTGGNMSGYSFNGTSLGQHATVSDPVSGDQTWEKVETSNVGLDLGFFNNRLSFTGELYIRDVKGILSSGKSLPSLYGASEPQVNANNMRTRGYEAVLSWNDSFSLANKRFSYGVSVSFSGYESYYTKCDNPSGLISDPYVGKKTGEIWGYRIDGLFGSDEEAAAYAANLDLTKVMKGCYNATGAYGIGVRAGDPRYLDLNDDGYVNDGNATLDNPGDRVIIGNSVPRFRYGINLNASWCGIDLSVFLQGIGRKDWYPGGDNLRFWGPYSRPYSSFIPRNFMSDVWSETNTDAYFPRPRAYAALSATNNTIYYANDRYLQNLAYCRLKNLTIGYTFPEKWTKKIFLQQIRVYFSGENLFTWTALKSKFLDPEEASASSNNYSNVYPWSKTFAFGLNVTF